MREFDIDERVHQEVARPTPYPLSIPFPGYSYLILHFPITGSEDGARAQEVDFIVGPHFLVTVRYESIEPLYALHRAIEAEELLGTVDAASWRMGALVESVLGRMYVAISTDIETAGRRLDRIERDIFSGRERRTVRAISDAERVLLRFHTTLERHREPLSDFLASLATPAFLGTKFDAHAAHIEARRVHAASLVSSYRAAAETLRVTNDSLLSASQNDISRTLNIMAFATFPLVAIAGVFGMNVENMPIVGLEQGFWIILGLMTLVVLGFVAIFRAKHWL
jgi:magnesium transporter